MTSSLASAYNIQALRAIRSWGNEYLLLCHPSRYTVKLLELFEGSQGGLQYHHLKFECGLVLEGVLSVETKNNNILTKKVLQANDFFVFPNRFIHREKAISRTLILEISTPHFNDRFRIDEDIENPLPSTSLSDVFEFSPKNQISDLERFDFKPVDVSSVPSLSLISF